MEAGVSPTALSLFSGCGGFCEGMKLAGFKVQAAVELDKYSCVTYRENFPDVALYEGDIADFNDLPKQTLQKDFGLRNPDIIFGGPPCQGYSQIGTRDLKDPRNKLYQEFVRALTNFQPRAFVMENVPNMLMLRKGLFRDKALAAFREAGYSNVAVVVLDSSEFGVPQQRKRAFYFGLRDDLRIKVDLGDFVTGVASALRVANPVSTWDAIGDLPETVADSGDTLDYPKISKPSSFMKEMRLGISGEVYSRAQKQLPAAFPRRRELHNHHTKEIQEKRLALIKLLEQGKKASSLPKDVWNGKRPEKWRRLHPDRPSHTLLAQMHRDLSEFVHPHHHRWITVREACRLQSFHDGFVPMTSEWQQLKQIGNAVPPLLGRTVGVVATELLAEAGHGRRRVKAKRPLQAVMFEKSAA